MRRGMALLCLVAWVLVGHSRVLVWKTNLTLWMDAAVKAPAKARGIVNVARALMDLDPDQPGLLTLFHVGQYRAVTERGISAAQQRNWFALGLANEGRYHRLHGRYDDAERLQHQALAEFPGLLYARSELVLTGLTRRGCRVKDNHLLCPPGIEVPRSF